MEGESRISKGRVFQMVIRLIIKIFSYEKNLLVKISNIKSIMKTLKT